MCPPKVPKVAPQVAQAAERRPGVFTNPYFDGSRSLMVGRSDLRTDLPARPRRNYQRTAVQTFGDPRGINGLASGTAPGSSVLTQAVYHMSGIQVR